MYACGRAWHIHIIVIYLGRRTKAAFCCGEPKPYTEENAIVSSSLHPESASFCRDCRVFSVFQECSLPSKIRRKQKDFVVGGGGHELSTQRMSQDESCKSDHFESVFDKLQENRKVLITACLVHICVERGFFSLFLLWTLCTFDI
jgi:hypothetical protein